MPNPTPHIENTKVDGGDRANPVITDITKGGKERIKVRVRVRLLKDDGGERRL